MDASFVSSGCSALPLWHIDAYAGGGVHSIDSVTMGGMHQLNEGNMDSFCFVKEEYLALRKEIDATIVQGRDLERNCVVALAIAFAWVATQTLTSDLAKVAWLVPTIIPIYGNLRDRAINQHLMTLGSYILTVESAILKIDEGVEGWEHYLARNDPKGLNRTSRQLWWVLVVLSAFVSAIGYANA